MNCEIITIIGTNYGNRLQNYALQEVLERLGCNVRTGRPLYASLNGISRIRRFIASIRGTKRGDMFLRFDRLIKWDYGKICYDNELVDLYIAGSDQIWNPLMRQNSDREFLTFCSLNKRIAYAASIGVEEVPKGEEERFKNNLSAFKNISVRENSAAILIEKLIGKKVPVV